MTERDIIFGFLLGALIFYLYFKLLMFQIMDYISKEMIIEYNLMTNQNRQENRWYSWGRLSCYEDLLKQYFPEKHKEWIETEIELKKEHEEEMKKRFRKDE